MKSKLLKTVVLASSLVFLNCGDDVTSAISDYTASLSSSSAGEVQPGTSSDSQGTAGTEISSSDAAQPTSGTTVEAGSSATVPGSSADVGPQAGSSSAAAPGAESSADVAASSSSVDAPASSSATAPAVSSSSEKAPAVSSSSSEEKVESSSSEAAKPKGVFLASSTLNAPVTMAVESLLIRNSFLTTRSTLLSCGVRVAARNRVHTVVLSVVSLLTALS